MKDGQDKLLYLVRHLLRWKAGGMFGPLFGGSVDGPADGGGDEFRRDSGGGGVSFEPLQNHPSDDRDDR